MPRGDTFRCKDASHLSSLNLSPQELSRAFGVSDSAVRSWLNGKKTPPKWTLVACEALKRRMGRGGTKCHLHVIVDKQYLDATARFLDAVSAHVTLLPSED